MANPLISRRKQICLYVKASTGAYGSTTATADASAVNTGANVIECFDVQDTPDVSQFDRNPNSDKIDGLAPAKGAKGWEVSFGMELKGSGTAGVAPQVGKALRACGLAQTVNSGSASIGAVYRDAKVSRGSVSPTVAGTFGAAVSGWMVVTVAAVTTNTSATFDAIFYPGDGTAATYYNAQVQNSGAAVSLSGGALNAVTVDFGDPSASTAGISVGDRFIVPLTSSSAVEVSYAPRNGSWEYADIGLIEDGRVKMLQNCMGTFTIENEAGGGPPVVRFTFRCVLAENSSGEIAAFADLAMITSDVVVDETIPPATLGAVFELDASALPCWTTLGFDAGNEVILRQCSAEASGYEAAIITSRNPTMRTDPEAAVFATYNPYTDLFTSVGKALEVELGDTAGNIVVIEAQNAVATEVSTGDRDGYIVNEQTWALKRPAAGPDFAAYRITFR